jgi:putative multiple sugar transport system substrate-binding protein
LQRTEKKKGEKNMKRLKKIMALIVASAALLSVVACAGSTTATTTAGTTAAGTAATTTAATKAATTTAAGAKTKVGVSMPTKDLQRWNQDGSNMKASLEKAGYTVDLQYASNDVNTQVSQIENMITGGCTILVIAAIDGSSLGTVLATAKTDKIPVIAYDRLIMNSDAVSYYATFDNYMVGTIQGNYIVDALKLKTATTTFNIEIVAGSADDNNAKFFYNGAMDVLKPYITKGTLKVVSGQVDFEKVATAAWKTETSQARMDNLLTAYYATGTKLDAVLDSNDSTALGVENSLNNAGYKVGTNWPIITGQDCDKANVKNMIAGKQSMSVFKDTRTLADKVVLMVSSIAKGTTVEINDTKTYDNGKGIVPTYLCTPVFADATNYKTILIDSGYYTAADLAS